MSFLVREAQERLEKSELIRLNNLIDWEKVRSKMGNLGRSGYGPNGYSPLKLFKALILQAWHNLSDESLEEALRVRLDFMVISGLEQVPDHTTLCRFRNLLTKLKLWDTLLKEVNRQLEVRGLKVKQSQGAIIDATIIESAARPGKDHCIIKQDGKYLKKNSLKNVSKNGKMTFFGQKTPCFLAFLPIFQAFFLHKAQ